MPIGIKKKFEIKFYIEILYKKTVAITLNIETKQKIIHFQSKKNEVTFTSRNFVCFHRMKKKEKRNPEGQISISIVNKQKKISLNLFFHSRISWNNFIICLSAYLKRMILL